jgi:Ca-activated chloride channel family protein
MTIQMWGRRLRLPILLVAAGAGIWIYAQEPTPVFKAKVDLVVLSFTVTDNKGKYVNGLKPSDFKVTEDGISEKLATFSEGSRPAMQILADGSMKPLLPTAPEAEKIGAATGDKGSGDAFVGTNVFVLFDTSNFMYRGFVYAEDAIADFVRGLDKADSVAVYTFSRNLSRAANLTPDRNDAIMGLRKAVAGDDTALYNGLLLTLRDAAKIPGTTPAWLPRTMSAPSRRMKASLSTSSLPTT